MRNGAPVVDAFTRIYRQPTVVSNRPTHFTVDDLIARMDQYAIDLSVVAPSPPFAATLEQIRTEHDALEWDVARYPRRLAGLAWAAPRFGKDGLCEAERCLGELGFKGIMLHGRLESFALDDGSADEYARLAERYGAYVFAYTALAARGSEPWRLVELARLFPNVPFILGHLGTNSNLVQSMGGAGLAGPVPNVILDTSTTTTDPMATYRCTVDLVGPDRVVFGSAAPLHHAAINLAKLDLVQLEPDIEARVVGGTMLRLLGLRPGQVGPNGESSRRELV